MEKIGQMRTKLNKKDLSYLNLIVCDSGCRIIKLIQKSRKPINKLIQKYPAHIMDFIEFILHDDWDYQLNSYYLKYNSWLSNKKYNLLESIIDRYYESDESIIFSEKEIDEIINVTAFMIDRLKAIDTFFKTIDFEYK